MRSSLAALALAAICLGIPCALAAQTTSPVTSLAVSPSASSVGTPAEMPSAQPGDADTPPPFVQRPKRAPQPLRPDMTYATRPAPKSFRDLPWGASLEQAKTSLGLVPVTSPKPLPGTFQRPNELLKLGQADVRTVAYYFPKGQFTGAGIMFEGEANFFLIKDHLIELYGPGRQVGDRYGWTWDSVNIDLRLKNGLGELRYTYEPPAKK
jgi:hypothetical protein